MHGWYTLAVFLECFKCVLLYETGNSSCEAQSRRFYGWITVAQRKLDLTLNQQPHAFIAINALKTSAIIPTHLNLWAELSTVSSVSSSLRVWLRVVLLSCCCRHSVTRILRSLQLVLLGSDGMLTEQLFSHKIHHSLKTDCDISKVIRETKLKKLIPAGEDHINNRTSFH